MEDFEGSEEFFYQVNSGCCHGCSTQISELCSNAEVVQASVEVFQASGIDRGREMWTKFETLVLSSCNHTIGRHFMSLRLSKSLIKYAQIFLVVISSETC